MTRSRVATTFANGALAILLLVLATSARDAVAESGERIDAVTWANKMLHSMNETAVDPHAKSLRAAGMKNLDNGDDDDLCPFVYDEYLATLDLPVSGEVVWRFRPKEYGFSHGYYCALSSKILGEDLEYRFGNCSCPPERYCKHDWGLIETKFSVLLAPVRMHVGKCQIYSWILALPIVLFIVFSIGCFCYCRPRRSRVREVIVVREDPRSGYVSMN
ncbi:Hypothetical Protein FCC1311_107112 [Hondaea fermentalgiana]|uniref:Uncharacterized protein n=1 Tax=Hondaea fermentalgiana TaxID=2315210 RepID=A0A2R5GUE2_9STRA|nr:Hypothetical Protein FCC1311_107112 [Hondaea fermentalgiana]|eukprot:GBG34487.1 Hypothetical Protein FCC1311_107112 [Hondaea fermentalgiana]